MYYHPWLRTGDPRYCRFPRDRYFFFAYKRESFLNLHQFTENRLPVISSKCSTINILFNFCTMEFKLSELTVELDSASNHAVKCIVCGQPFKAPLKKGNVKRHFEDQHQYKFIRDRSEKRTSDSGTRQPSKRFKKAVLFSDFRDADDFSNNCVLMHSDNALPYAFWDKESTKRLVQPYSDMYKVTISGNYFSTKKFLFSPIKLTRF